MKSDKVNNTEYPWEEVEIVKTPVWKSAKCIISAVSDNCTIRLMECIRNEPEVCMAEYFIEKQHTDISGSIREDDIFGPYHSHELKHFMIAMNKVYQKWEQAKFNR
jgi:hypothetical protein